MSRRGLDWLAGKLRIDPLWPPHRSDLTPWAAVFAVGIFRAAWGIDPLPPALARAPFDLALWSVRAWFAGACLFVVGSYWPRRRRGVSLELSACFLAAGGCLFYLAVLLFFTTPLSNAAAAGAVVSGVAAGFVNRIVRIGLYLRASGRYARAQQATHRLGEAKPDGPP